MASKYSNNIVTPSSWTNDLPNCAHCHQPGGYVPTGFLLDFRLETDFVTTGIYSHRGQIESRIQSTTPTYLMPQLGRSLVHDEGVTMLLEYLEAIED